MTSTYRQLAAPAPRLLAAAQARAGAAAFDLEGLHVLGAAADRDAAVTPLPAPGTADRLLVMSWIGAHPDATEPLLGMLWRLEEAARATGLPVLVLRLAPLVGGHSPWSALLAGRPRLDPRLARSLVQPIREDDAIAGLARVWSGHVDWRGWFEVCGADPWTVGELGEAAAAGAFGHVAAAPRWEPGPGVLRAMGLSEWEPWAGACGVAPRPVLEGARA